ncbi:MAG: tRNA (guanosine(37)-N1)-methyltransferase TrmD [Candidatus Cloacimonetes bacterium]|nr:tRNA (guanosine(37)-N1)-methyltransferase TrmD [Candidatus Cloacimonadota bacterium]
MKIEVLSLFPEAFGGFLESSMVARAISKKKLQVRLHDFRKYSLDKHHKVDDYAYGGFAGMVLAPQPVYDSINHLLESGPAPVIYFTPQGRKLDQKILEDYSQLQRVILLCGHYKELDQRIRNLCISDEISLGDFVLSGGELASMVFIDGVSRLLPGVLSDFSSAQSDSFSSDYLGFPCYTRPESFMELKVPDVLTTGDHQAIASWAEASAELITRTRRPDLIKK